jgi:hypothetical protein
MVTVGGLAVSRKPGVLRSSFTKEAPADRGRSGSGRGRLRLNLGVRVPMMVAVERRGEADVVRGDPVLRRRALLVLPLLLALGVAALATAPRASRLLILWLQQSPDPGRHAVLAMLGFAAPFTLLAWLVGVDVVRRSVKTFRACRFPPPGMRVVRDTPVLRGNAARFLGVAGLVLATALLTAGSALPFFAYRIGAVLRDGCPRATPRAAMPPD